MMIQGTGNSPMWYLQKDGQATTLNIRALEVAARGRRDSVSISAAGRANQLIETLKKNKQEITDHKNELITQTLEDGLDLESIEEQIEFYDERLRNIDEMISQVVANQTQNAIEQQKENQGKAAKEPQNEQEAEAVQQQALNEAAVGLEQAKTVHKVSARAKGDGKVLEGQIKLDKSTQKIRNPKPGDTAAGRFYLEGKSGKLAALRAQASAAYLQSAKGLNKAREKTELAGEVLQHKNADKQEEMQDFSITV